MPLFAENHPLATRPSHAGCGKADLTIQFDDDISSQGHPEMMVNMFCRNIALGSHFTSFRTGFFVPAENEERLLLDSALRG